MKNSFKVVEDRGYGIRYINFIGTYEECETKIQEYLNFQKLEVLDGDATSQVWRNGNNDPFTFEIEEL